MRRGEELRAGLATISATYFDWHDPKRPDQPWIVTARGREWAVVTDGHTLVGVERGLFDGALEPAPPHVVKVGEAYLAPVISDFSVISAEDLLRFAGVGLDVELCEDCGNKRRVECPECEGKGGEECECSCGDIHDRECKRCHGSGEVQCETCGINGPDERHRPALIFDMPIDRNLLARTLAAVMPSGDLIVGKSEKNVLVVREAGDANWTAVLSPMNERTKTVVRLDKPETWDAVDPAGGRVTG